MPDHRGYSDALLSLRGLAALGVCLYHVALVFPKGGSVNQTILWGIAGPSAVIFFFVHSGFVLALGFRELTVQAVGRFYLRRVFRLWPMIACSCVLATAYIAVGGTASAPASVSAWYRALMTGSAADLDFWRNLWLSRNGLNWFFWSLAVEVVGSLILPALVLLCRLAWPWLAGALVGLFLIATAPVWGGSDDVRRLEWIGAIAVGAALAYAPKQLVSRYQSAAVAVAVVVLTLARHFLPILTAVAVETVASAVIVQTIYNGRWRLLETPTLVGLGRISYSFYVNSLLSIHIAGKLAASVASGPAAVILCAGLAVAINIALSTATYWLVERPGMLLGKCLTASPSGTADKPPIPGRIAPRRFLALRR